MAPSTLRSHRHDSPMLWLSVLGGSLALHLIVLLLGRWYYAQPQRSPSSGAPIPLDFVEVNPKGTASRASRPATPSNTAPKAEPPKVTAPTEPFTAQPSIVENLRISRTPRSAQSAIPRESPSPKPSPQTDRAIPQPGQEPLNQPDRQRNSRPSPPAQPPEPNSDDRPSNSGTPPSNPKDTNSGAAPPRNSESEPPSPSSGSPSPDSAPPSGSTGGSPTDSASPSNPPDGKPITSGDKLELDGLITGQISGLTNPDQTSVISARLLDTPTISQKIDNLPGLGSQTTFDLNVRVRVEHDTTESPKKSSTALVRGFIWEVAEILPDSPALDPANPALKENLKDVLNKLFLQSQVVVEVTVKTDENGKVPALSAWDTRIRLTKTP